MYAYALKCGADLSAARGRTGIAEEYLERQKEILQAFNLTSADVKKQAIELAGYLRTLTA